MSVLLLSIFYNLGIFLISTGLIYGIEHELKFTHILLFHGFVLTLLVGFGFDGFMLIFALLDLIIVVIIHEAQKGSEEE